MLFSIQPFAHVIVRRSNGVYQQCRLALRGAHVYATVSGGFVRLSDDGATSCPTIRWDHIDDPDHTYAPDGMGRLVLTPEEKR